MEKKLVLCDTNIFIHWFNNHQPTIDKLQTIGLDKIAVSVITVMELIEGVDNKQQLQQLKNKIKIISLLILQKKFQNCHCNL